MMYGGARGDAWSIQVKKTGTWPEGVNFAFGLNEHMEVDEAGNPLTQAQRAERDKKMREAMQSGRGASFDFSSMPRTGILQQIGGANETITYGLNVNPKHVKELVVRGTKQRKIDITNIPLDPK